MELQNHPPSDNIPANPDTAQIASTYQIAKQTTPPSKKKQLRAPVGDLTSRLIGILLWLSFGTVVGCIGQMAATRRPPNIGAAMAIGLACGLTCAYKDLESGQVPKQLLNNPQRFFNRFEGRLDDQSVQMNDHSVQLAGNTGGQERLEKKLNSLSDQVDTLTLAMVRPPVRLSEPISQERPSVPPVSLSSNASLNGNGQSQHNLGTGF